SVSAVRLFLPLLQHRLQVGDLPPQPSLSPHHHHHVDQQDHPRYRQPVAQKLVIPLQSTDLAQHFVGGSLRQQQRVPQQIHRSSVKSHAPCAATNRVRAANSPG